MSVVAKCWRCGAWISSDEEYREHVFYFTCEDCLDECRNCGEMRDLVPGTGLCESCLGKNE